MKDEDSKFDSDTASTANVMEEAPSRRLIRQRLRNRRIEACELLALGNEAVRRQGWSEYFNWFYDSFPDEGPLAIDETETPDENEALNAVLVTMNAACDATPALDYSDEDLISTGWPERIQQVALRAIEVLLKRGRFSEEIEQDEPD